MMINHHRSPDDNNNNYEKNVLLLGMSRVGKGQLGLELNENV